jgi:hypothetical protein
MMFFEIYSGVMRRLVEVGGVWQAAPPVPAQPDSVNWGTGHFGVCDAQMGSDGALYFLCLGINDVPRGLYRVVKAPATSIPEITAPPLTICSVSPNPIRASQGATFRIGALPSGTFRISLKNIEGRVVRTLAATSHGEVFWDGRVESGQYAAPGIYVWTLEESGERKASGKITILR